MTSAGCSRVAHVPAGGRRAGARLLPEDEENGIKLVGIVTAAATFASASQSSPSSTSTRPSKLQFFADHEWIEFIRSNYTVGLDGISLPLFVLSSFITLVVMIYTYENMPEAGNPKAFIILMLVLQVGMAGTFVAQDLILFFVFFEMVLLPMYFMIGVWGGEDRQYASLKFFLYTMFGSALMLVGFLALFFQSGGDSFSFLHFNAIAQLAEQPQFARDRVKQGDRRGGKEADENEPARFGECLLAEVQQGHGEQNQVEVDLEEEENPVRVGSEASRLSMAVPMRLEGVDEFSRSVHVDTRRHPLYERALHEVAESHDSDAQSEVLPRLAQHRRVTLAENGKSACGHDPGGGSQGSVQGRQEAEQEQPGAELAEAQQANDQDRGIQSHNACVVRIRRELRRVLVPGQMRHLQKQNRRRNGEQPVL